MHSLWKGSISFGLVNIPVKMYTASREQELKFILLHKKDQSQIRYARICKMEDKEVPWNEIVKGFEYQKGEYVILDKEDFEAADPKKSKSIEIVNFTKETDIDTIYFDKPYYLEPEKNGAHAYILLREALKKSKKIGIAQYVLHNHEYLAAIKPYKDLIVLHQLRYDEEIIQPSAIEVAASEKKSSASELDIALKLIDHLTTAFQPEAYKNTYIEELKAIIENKAKGKKVHPKGAEPSPTKITDIMSLLKASLDEKPKKNTKGRKSIAYRSQYDA